MSEDQERAVVRDYENAMNTTEIQTKYGIGPGTLYRILDKHGVKPRRPGPAKASNGTGVEKHDSVAEAVEEFVREQTVTKPKVVAVVEDEPVAEPEPEPEPIAPPQPVLVPDPTPVHGHFYDDHVYQVTVEYRTRSVVEIKAKSIVDAARAAASLTSPTGGQVEVITLARQD